MKRLIKLSGLLGCKSERFLRKSCPFCGKKYWVDYNGNPLVKRKIPKYKVGDNILFRDIPESYIRLPNMKEARSIRGTIMGVCCHNGSGSGGGAWYRVFVPKNKLGDKNEARAGMKTFPLRISSGEITEDEERRYFIRVREKNILKKENSTFQES